MNPTQPAATPAPIHDITGPVWFLPYPLWMLIGAAVLLLGIAAFAVWIFLRIRKAKPLTVKERTLAALAELRNSLPGADSYSFGVRVSDALRKYIRDQHGLDAVTRTSLEFLEALRHNHVFNDNEKAALSEFLSTADLLKYARHSAGREEMGHLLDVAERLVRSEPAALQPVSAR